VLITHVKTVDHAKMVLTITRVTAQLGSVGTIVRIVSSKNFILISWSQSYKYIMLTLGRTRGGGLNATPHEVFLEFILAELPSRAAVFISCAHIHKTHFNTSLVRIGCYGNEICCQEEFGFLPF